MVDHLFAFDREFVFDGIGIEGEGMARRVFFNTSGIVSKCDVIQKQDVLVAVEMSDGDPDFLSCVGAEIGGVFTPRPLVFGTVFSGDGLFLDGGVAVCRILLGGRDCHSEVLFKIVNI